MKTVKWQHIAASIACLVAGDCLGYELATHAKITNAAFVQSQLGGPNGSLQRVLGIDVWSAPINNEKVPFRAVGLDIYLDITGSDIRIRRAFGYEGKIISDFVSRFDGLTDRGWLLRGVIREDDASDFVNFIGRTPMEPRDDPFGNFNRFCNHFFDPLAAPASAYPNGRSLTGFCFNETPRFDNAQWALGSLAPFATLPAELATRRNHFSVLDAREAMWRALTLRDRTGNPLNWNTDLNQEGKRKVHWATTFRALGDVIHLVQDMAQPQHTRNEGHGVSNKGYEEYIDARARGNKEFAIDGFTLAPSSAQLPDLKYTGYPSPRFSRYSDYWSTQASSPNALGLADYSNRGFFTMASNFPNSKYPKPSSNLADYTAVRAPVIFFGTQLQSAYLFGTVEDNVMNSTDGITMTTVGLLPNTSSPSAKGKSVLSKRNYDDRANLLIPRAVAYSAGLIDYFFRGRLEITPPAEGIYSLVDHADFSAEGKPATDASGGFKGFKTIKLQLKNTTPTIAPSGGGTAVPQDMTGGTLVAVLKFYRNKNYTDNLLGEPSSVDTYNSSRSLAEEIVVSSRVKDGSGMALPALVPVTTSAQTFIFEFDQELPINATDVKLQVVYRGPLGSEADAVVVETIDISEPSYFTYMNATDYIAVGNSVYTRSQINASAGLQTQIRPATCIDSMTSQLRETCFPITPISFTMTFGNNNNAKADVSLPNERQYHRVAMLTPADSPATIGLTNATCNSGGAFLLPGRTLQKNYFALPNGGVETETIAMPMAIPPVRNVPFWRGVICVHDGDQSNLVSLSTTWWAPMSENVDSTRFPKPTGNFKFGAP